MDPSRLKHALQLGRAVIAVAGDELLDVVIASEATKQSIAPQVDGWIASLRSQ